MSGAARTKSGVALGTTALITVEVGFTPKHVMLVRETQASGEYELSCEYFDSMPPGSGFIVKDDNSTARANTITTGGVTILDNPAGKFTIGTDADLNRTGVKIYWFASE